MITTITAILLNVLFLITSLYLVLEINVRNSLGITLKQFIESMSILSSIDNTKKHKSLEIVVSQISTYKIIDIDNVKKLRQDVLNTLDKINRIPYELLSDQDKQIVDSLRESSYKMGMYLFNY